MKRQVDVSYGLTIRARLTVDQDDKEAYGLICHCSIVDPQGDPLKPRHVSVPFDAFPDDVKAEVKAALEKARDAVADKAFSFASMVANRKPSGLALEKVMGGRQ